MNTHSLPKTGYGIGLFTFLALLGTLVSNGQSQSKVVWSPLVDQWAIGYFANCPNGVCPTSEDPHHHPDFNVGQSKATREGIVLNALKAAYSKGVRTVDINYYAGPNNAYQSAPGAPASATAAEKAYHDALVESGDIWVREVNALNGSSTIKGTDYMKMRIRVNATRVTLDQILYRTDRAGHAGAAASAIACAKDMNYAGAVNGSDNFLVDLSNATVRGYIVDYTNLVLNAIWPRLSSRTTIESIALVLDCNGESSTMSNNESFPITYFANSPYPATGTFSSKVSHYKSKQAALKSAYIAFSGAVHAFNGSLKTAVFMQTWAFDARLRSGFDLSSLLKGSGIDFIHHTHPPQSWNGSAPVPISYDVSLRFAAYTASVAKQLGKGYDTEFSWPWYVVPQVDGNSINNYASTKMTDGNADLFYFQALAGFRYESNGFTYCNWITRNFTNPPTSTNWGNLLGKSSPWDDTHLTRPGAAGIAPGLLTYSAWAPAKKAIYISTLGRLQCEENSTCLGWGPSTPYLTWFSEFGINYTGERVDILTDQLIKDSDITTLLNKYDVVYLPYETRGYTDPTVLSKMRYYWSGAPLKFWVQNSPSSTDKGYFTDWGNITNSSLSSF